MARDRFCRYIWILQQLYEYEELSFDELEELWLKSSQNDTKEGLSKRTFINHKKEIESIFDVNIIWDKKRFKYRIENRKSLEEDTIKKWLLDSFAISNNLLEAKNLEARISLQSNAIGSDFILPVLRAMKQNNRLEIKYKSFNDDATHLYIVEPYFIKNFARRWYIVARKKDSDSLRIFAIDRIIDINVLEETFEIDKRVGSVQSYFKDCYGVEVNPEDYDLSKVRIKVYNKHHKSSYFRHLPLHHSQKEIEANDEYSIFEYKLYLSYDFKQELLSHGDEVEVIYPEWFRSEVKETLASAIRLYSK